MKTTSPSSSHQSTLTKSADLSIAVPWLNLRMRIRDALARQRFFMASASDLSTLWRGERVDAAERRRRISVFAAQHQWRVETRADGTTARFQPAPVSGLFPKENLSRNHE